MLNGINKGWFTPSPSSPSLMGIEHEDYRFNFGSRVRLVGQFRKTLCNSMEEYCPTFLAKFMIFQNYLSPAREAIPSYL